MMMSRTFEALQGKPLEVGRFAGERYRSACHLAELRVDLALQRLCPQLK